MVNPSGVRVTFRVSNLTPKCTEGDLVTILNGVFKTDSSLWGLTIGSLANSPYNQNERVATISFESVPPALLDGANQWLFDVPRDCGSGSDENGENFPQKIAIDTHFRGFTDLQSYRKESELKIDIIVVTGLGGHAFGSFKEKGGSHMWLRDSLPDDLPGARIIIYGYDTPIQDGQSFQNIADLATKLRDGLCTIRRGQRHRPLLFIAHSLGGIIVKQTLLSMARSSEKYYIANLKAVRAALFFGVPHQGMDTKALLVLAKDGPGDLVSSLGRSSAFLPSLNDNFREECGHVKIISFYETKQSPTLRNVDGKWELSGDHVVLVTQASATYHPKLGTPHAHAINQTHSNMVKYTLFDSDYRQVLGQLLELVDSIEDRSFRKIFYYRSEIQILQVVLNTPLLLGLSLLIVTMVACYMPHPSQPGFLIPNTSPADGTTSNLSPSVELFLPVLSMPSTSTSTAISQLGQLSISEHEEIPTQASTEPPIREREELPARRSAELLEGKPEDVSPVNTTLDNGGALQKMWDKCLTYVQSGVAKSEILFTFIGMAGTRLRRSAHSTYFGAILLAAFYTVCKMFLPGGITPGGEGEELLQQLLVPSGTAVMNTLAIKAGEVGIYWVAGKGLTIAWRFVQARGPDRDDGRG